MAKPRCRHCNDVIFVENEIGFIQQVNIVENEIVHKAYVFLLSVHCGICGEVSKFYSRKQVKRFLSYPQLGRFDKRSKLV